MSKDVVVVVSLQQVDITADTLDILLISTNGQKDIKEYTTLEEVEKDWAKETVIYKQASAIFGQAKAQPTPERLIGKVRVVGFEEPESAKDLITAIKEFQEIDNDWYIFMTDRMDDDYISALADFAAESEPGEPELSNGAEDHRKLYYAQTSNKEYVHNARRSVVVYAEKEKADECIEAAWIGAVGPWYPQSITWKFKMPMGVSVPALRSGEISKLEENHINFVTNEYKKNYIKNGCCLDGEWIDAIIGGDWITKTMREKLYEIFLNNRTIPYTDAGFALVVAAVFETLNEATDHGIIARNDDSQAGIYTVTVPKRADATDKQVASRQMPDIHWEAQLSGAVHGVKTKGVLKVNL